jgi:hypothetical protein
MLADHQSANTAGIYGAQIFRADDRPRYRRGFAIGIGILAFGVCLVAIRYVSEVLERRRNKKQITSDASSDSQLESGARTPEALGSPVKV